jgi:hypothetical protein
MEVSRMLTQSELEREKYEARLKYQRDELSRRHEAEQLVREAEQRGELFGFVQSQERFLKVEPTPKETLRAMTLEQLQQLAEQLEARLTEHA